MSDELSLDLFGEGGGEKPHEPAPPSRGDAPGPGVDEPEGGSPDERASATERARSAAASGEVSRGPDVEEPRVWSVTQVNRAVRGLLEGSVDPLWVGGEVGGWSRSRAGHCYFTLKDDRAQIRCVMFSREASLLPADPEDGMQVRAFGSLTLYEARGEYQLVVRRVEAEGAEGLWRLAFEKLRSKLEAEGLLDPARKRALPRLPRCVGVVTSTSGAALRDVLSCLARRAPWVRVVVRGARVQGEGASLELARALGTLAARGTCDVIIVGRGGGSLEDLWAFNEEPLARAIAACPVPVISAVGHEVDVTISDLVADHRAPTPTAAAEAVSTDLETVLRTLEVARGRMVRGLVEAVASRRRGVSETRWALGRAVERHLSPLRQTVDRGQGALERAMKRLLERRRHELATRAGRLEALSPLATLGRGYAVARDEAGRVLRRRSDFPPGLEFVLRVADGSVRCASQGPREEAPS